MPLLLITGLAASIWSLPAAVPDGGKLMCRQTNECLWISGRLVSEMPDSGYPPSNVVHHRTFEVFTDGWLWKMRVFDSNAPTNGIFLYWEMGTDGEQVIHVAQYNTNYAGTQLRRVSKPGEPFVGEAYEGRFGSANDGIGLIAEGIVPVSYQASCCDDIWLAYASGCHLKDQAGLELPVFFESPSVTKHGVTMPWRWVASGSFPFTPRELSFDNPGFQMGFNAIGELAKIPTVGSFTNFTFRAAETMNVGPWSIPKKFESQTYRVRLVESRDVLRTNSIVRGTTTAARLVPRPDDFLPNPPRVTMVDDIRGAGRRGGIGYLTSGKWKSLDEALASPRR